MFNLAELRREDTRAPVEGHGVGAPRVPFLGCEAPPEPGRLNMKQRRYEIHIYKFISKK